MRVLHLNTYDIQGGAARAVYRLHTGLKNLNVDSLMGVAEKMSSDPNVLGPTTDLDQKRTRAYRFLDRQPRRLLNTQNPNLISPAWVERGLPFDLDQVAPDIIHLHWINNGFLKPESLPKISNGRRLFWTLHDMWSFSGAEHYVGTDLRYQVGYKAENRPDGESGYDLCRSVWQRKKKAYPKIKDLTLIAPSRWIADCARKSILFKDRPVEVISHGVDETIYTPVEKQKARRDLGLPLNKKLILFGAIDATGDLRKGFHFLEPTFEILRSQGLDRNASLVIFGSSEATAEQSTRVEKFGFETFLFSHINEDQKLAQLYSACDTMIVPSMEEAFGQTALEAMSCGIPVVGFRVGGLPDLIHHRENGFLASCYEVSELAEGITFCLKDSHRLGEWARKTVEDSFTLRQMAENHLKLYQKPNTVF